MTVQYHCHVIQTETCYNATALPLVEVLIILSIISIKMDLLLNSNYKRRKPEFPGSSGISIVFRLVAYLQNIICLKLIIIPKLTYISFGIILTHFYIKINFKEIIFSTYLNWYRFKCTVRNLKDKSLFKKK